MPRKAPLLLIALAALAPVAGAADLPPDDLPVEVKIRFCLYEPDSCASPPPPCVEKEATAHGIVTATRAGAFATRMHLAAEFTYGCGEATITSFTLTCTAGSGWTVDECEPQAEPLLFPTPETASGVSSSSCASCGTTGIEDGELEVEVDNEGHVGCIATYGTWNDIDLDCYTT